jgi:broad specificity phosphatase PhoE
MVIGQRNPEFDQGSLGYSPIAQAAQPPDALCLAFGARVWRPQYLCAGRPATPAAAHPAPDAAAPDDQPGSWIANVAQLGQFLQNWAMLTPAQTVYFITHPDVLIDPAVPVPNWPLSPRGRERMVRALVLPWVSNVRAVWCSTERKARDGASILAGHLHLPLAELAELGENDRSATGYLPKHEFEMVADLFFAHPELSVRGWERAVDAQRRIVAAIHSALGASAKCGGNIAIISHGGVGTLLLCHLRGEAISRQHDQPPNNGGNYYAFDADTRDLIHDWRQIDA